jgi:uncharacterized membrane protein YccC
MGKNKVQEKLNARQMLDQAAELKVAATKLEERSVGAFALVGALLLMMTALGVGFLVDAQLTALGGFSKMGLHQQVIVVLVDIGAGIMLGALVAALVLAVRAQRTLRKHRNLHAVGVGIAEEEERLAEHKATVERQRATAERQRAAAEASDARERQAREEAERVREMGAKRLAEQAALEEAERLDKNLRDNPDTAKAIDDFLADPSTGSTRERRPERKGAPDKRRGTTS